MKQIRIADRRDLAKESIEEVAVVNFTACSGMAGNNLCLPHGYTNERPLARLLGVNRSFEGVDTMEVRNIYTVEKLVGEGQTQYIMTYAASNPFEVRRVLEGKGPSGTFSIVETKEAWSLRLS